MEIFTDPSGRFWGKVGAGGLFFAESTGRYLVAKRSANVNEPNTWGTWGGAVEDGESPEEAVKREIGEEAGYYGDYTLKPVSVFSNGDYKYHNFLIVIPDEFTPEHSWETSGHEWVEHGEWPQPMHFGMREMVKQIPKSLEISEDIDIISKLYDSTQQCRASIMERPWMKRSFSKEPSKSSMMRKSDLLPTGTLLESKLKKSELQSRPLSLPFIDQSLLQQVPSPTRELFEKWIKSPSRSDLAPVGEVETARAREIYGLLCRVRVDDSPFRLEFTAWSYPPSKTLVFEFCKLIDKSKGETYSKSIFESNHLDEDLEDWDTDVWLHFSDFPGVKINPQQFHQDPAGIYLFPEGFETIGNWWKKKYKFRVQLKRSLKILDLAKLSKESAIELMKKLVPEKYHEAYEQEIQTAKNPVDMFWEVLQSYFILTNEGPGKAAWNKALRNAGYDAVFDDTGSIHSVEVQLLVLDPRDIKVIEQVEQKATGFEELSQAFEHLKKLMAPYGKIETTDPKAAMDSWTKTKEITAHIRVTDVDGNWLSFELRPRFEQSKDRVPAEIEIRPGSNKELKGMKGETTRLDLRKGKYQPSDMDLQVQMRLDAVFGPVGENWDSMFGDVALMLEASDIKIVKIPKEELESKTDRYDVMIDGEWDSSWDRKSDAVARVKALKQDPERYKS